jgi:hypothetical protein
MASIRAARGARLPAGGSWRLPASLGGRWQTGGCMFRLRAARVVGARCGICSRPFACLRAQFGRTAGVDGRVETAQKGRYDTGLAHHQMVFARFALQFLGHWRARM